MFVSKAFIVVLVAPYLSYNILVSPQLYLWNVILIFNAHGSHFEDLLRSANAFYNHHSPFTIKCRHLLRSKHLHKSTHLPSTHSTDHLEVILVVIHICVSFYNGGNNSSMHNAYRLSHRVYRVIRIRFSAS